MSISITKHLMFTKYFFIPFQTSLNMVSHCEIDITLMKKLHLLKIDIVSSILYDELYNMVKYYKHSN
jgi:hypothetical protein